jgi:hypothetical protein
MTHAEQIRRYLRRCKGPKTVAQIHDATGILKPSIRRELNSRCDDLWQDVLNPLFRCRGLSMLAGRERALWEAL